VYNRNLKIYRSVDNRIDVQVRNSDQKASNLTPPVDPIDNQLLDNVLVFNLVTRETKDLIFQKDFSAMDLATGKVTVTLTEYELLDIDLGFYDYSIIKEVRKPVDTNSYKVTSRIPMYMDSQYDTLGTIEVLGDVLGDVEPSVTVDKFEYVNPFTTGEENSKYYISSIIDAKPQINSAGGLHTFQFYSTNYQGAVTIQGSIDEQGGTPKKWVDISPVDLTSERYKNITGKWNWFRIKHVPGSISKIASFTISQTLLLTYNVSIGNAGQGYSVGDNIIITGNRLGGELNTNDLTITVSAVNSIGAITGITWTGLSYNGVKTFVLDDSNITVGTLDKILYR
jgi:hypothetical protein